MSAFETVRVVDCGMYWLVLWAAFPINDCEAQRFISGVLMLEGARRFAFDTEGEAREFARVMCGN